MESAKAVPDRFAVMGDSAEQRAYPGGGGSRAVFHVIFHI